MARLSTIVRWVQKCKDSSSHHRRGRWGQYWIHLGNILTQGIIPPNMAYFDFSPTSSPLLRLATKLTLMRTLPVCRSRLDLPEATSRHEAPSVVMRGMVAQRLSSLQVHDYIVTARMCILLITSLWCAKIALLETLNALSAYLGLLRDLDILNGLYGLRG